MRQFKFISPRLNASGHPFRNKKYPRCEALLQNSIVQCLVESGKQLRDGHHVCSNHRKAKEVKFIKKD